MNIKGLAKQIMFLRGETSAQLVSTTETAVRAKAVNVTSSEVGKLGGNSIQLAGSSKMTLNVGLSTITLEPTQITIAVGAITKIIVGATGITMQTLQVAQQGDLMTETKTVQVQLNGDAIKYLSGALNIFP